MVSNKHPELGIIDLQSFLYSFGFHSIGAYNSIFIYKSAKGIAFLLQFVVDIIFTASSKLFLLNPLQQLNVEFVMNYLSNFHYCMGIRESPKKKGVFLKPYKYAQEHARPAKLTLTSS